MKKLFAIVLVTLIALPAFSQIKFGIKAGVSTTSTVNGQSYNVTSGTNTYTVEAIKNAKYGFHGGVFLRLTLLGIYLQPELIIIIHGLMNIMLTMLQEHLHQIL